MAQEQNTTRQQQDQPNSKTLIIGNYCHDIISHNNIITKTLGGATSFLSNILDPLSPSSSLYISKSGPDFAFPVSHPPITIPSSSTTLFHSHFPSNPNNNYHGDRVLRRIRACDPILASDLPSHQFEFGVAAGVAGEILPETLARMIELCRVMFVDVQGMIRVFDPVDGKVGLVSLRKSGFWGLVSRIGFLKASEDEAAFVDLEEVRRVCCVVVTEGRKGCRVYWEDGEVKVEAFEAVEIDPTGAGDSFLGGFVVGLSWGLDVADAALLGNFFGALTVAQIGVPVFDLRLLKVCSYEFV